VDPAGLIDAAPALWVGVLGTLLLVGLDRWYDRVPARVALGFALAVALLYGEVLAGGGVLLPLDNLRGDAPFQGLTPADPHGNLLQGDLLYLIHPARREARRALAAGEWPLWSPRIGAGMPLMADPQAQALQPLTTLGEGPLPAAAGPAAVAALRTLLALIFTYLLLRRLGGGRGPATAGAFAYGLGGFLQLWVGWPLANTAALLPAVLYALVRSEEEGGGVAAPGRRRDWALLVLSTAALLLAGHPETIVYALVVVAVFAVARLRRRAAGRRLAWAGRVVTAFGLAATLAAPALLPFAEILPHTLRWARFQAHSVASEPPGGPEAARGDLAPGADPGRAPATRLIQAVAPNAFGNSRFVHYWGLRNTNEDAAGFVGTATLLAALLALLLAALSWIFGRRSSGWTAPAVRHARLGLVLAGTAAVLLALPAGWGGVVPPGGLSGRLALVLDLGLALAATGALERFRRGGLPRWFRWGAPPAVALALAGFHLWAYAAWRSPADPATLDVLRWGWVHWHLRFAALAAVVLVLGAGKRWTAPAVALLVAVELILAHAPANPPMPQRLAFPSPPALAFLEQAVLDQSGGSDGGGARLAGAGKVLLPNLAAVYGLADVRVFSPLTPLTYARLLAPAIASWDGEIPLLDDRDHPRLYDRLGVGWLLLAPGGTCPAGTATAFDDPSGLVCRRPGARPLLTADGRPPRTLHRAAGGAWWAARLGAPRNAGPYRLETAIAALPGWRVLAAGGPTSATRAATRVQPSGAAGFPRRAVPLDGPAVGASDGPGQALLAASLPRESRRVDLLYRPTGFLVGMLLAGLGTALLLAWTAPPPR